MAQQTGDTSERFSKASAISWLWCRLSRWPLKWLWRMASALGPIIYRFNKREREVTERNLTVVYPDLANAERQTLARQSLRHSTATMLELGHAWMAEPSKVEASILTVQGRDKLDNARSEGRGVIVLARILATGKCLTFGYRAISLYRHVRATQNHRP
ncbi:hypothetical protein HSBAA_15690 [Vreelandella sulfidaeris]|uniref:Lipid A biosynthesis lauroyl acyltransferase n=1 Tax=Vreelandella sulfidaeris TaxID=115553 RepID=A0A455U4W0_9GAMM|nr:hypothetical protein HSBAA_15690 [Halomonas sulfidaeris]